MIDGQVHASSWQQSFSDKKLSERASDGGARWCSIGGSFSSEVSYGILGLENTSRTVLYCTCLNESRPPRTGSCRRVVRGHAATGHRLLQYLPVQ